MYDAEVMRRPTRRSGIKKEFKNLVLKKHTAAQWPRTDLLHTCIICCRDMVLPMKAHFQQLKKKGLKTVYIYISTVPNIGMGMVT